MRCLRCQNLERALEIRQSEYNEALDSAYFRVSTKFAAYVSVELERARNELQDHRSVCASAVKQPVFSAAVALPRFAPEELRDECAAAAA
jgi:hypothetical protein